MSKQAKMLRKTLQPGAVTFHACLARIKGSSPSHALFLSEIIHWSQWAEERNDGWVYRTQAQIREARALSPHRQRKAREFWSHKDIGVLSERKKGMPLKLEYKINWERLAELITESDTGAKPDMHQGAKQESDTCPEQESHTGAEQELDTGAEQSHAHNAHAQSTNKSEKESETEADKQRACEKDGEKNQTAPHDPLAYMDTTEEREIIEDKYAELFGKNPSLSWKSKQKLAERIKDAGVEEVMRVLEVQKAWLDSGEEPFLERNHHMGALMGQMFEQYQMRGRPEKKKLTGIAALKQEEEGE